MEMQQKAGRRKTDLLCLSQTAVLIGSHITCAANLLLPALMQ